MPTYRLHVAYDGAPYHGFARQQELTTVQGTIEDALAKILRSPVVTTGAGRTDAGVHALGQVMSFTIGAPLEDLLALQRRLNALCGPTIAVLELAEAPAGFDARFSAASRTYEYAIFTRQVHDPFSRHVAWHHAPAGLGHGLDAEAMHEAAQALLGTHDFSSFGRVPEGATAVRNLLAISVQRTEDLVVIRVSANAFIQQMVRSIVGTLVKVGEGEHPPGWVAEVLEARDRAAAGPVAPPHGLFLVEVDYPEELVRA
ncbi:MAG: tRNA pseudouridine38-40 synthase [Actinomycetota bacterium]|nr:tRNA pseudouridine38-40 synthase [Actinomycetota bacterium]